MSDKVYVGDVGTDIIVDCGQDISGATSTSLEVNKPDGTNVSWTATIYQSNYLKYTIIADDFDQEGIYRVQSKLTLGGWTGRGETANFRVYNPYH
jgi:hypothetical protein